MYSFITNNNILIVLLKKNFGLRSVLFVYPCVPFFVRSLYFQAFGAYNIGIVSPQKPLYKSLFRLSPILIHEVAALLCWLQPFIPTSIAANQIL